MFIAPHISPSPEAVYYVGDKIVITCTPSSDFTSVQWFINNMQYDNSQPDIMVNAIPGILSAISIRNILQEYDNTVIRCESFYSDDQLSSSEEITILLQGIIIIII